MAKGKARRIALDWQKLFAFEQVERKQRESRAPRIDARLGAKIGDKGCTIMAPPD
jgi:hypothetical protein